MGLSSGYLGLSWACGGVDASVGWSWCQAQLGLSWVRVGADLAVISFPLPSLSLPRLASFPPTHLQVHVYVHAGVHVDDVSVLDVGVHVYVGLNGHVHVDVHVDVHAHVDVHVFM